MPSVQDAIQLFNIPVRWETQLVSIQQHFHYILFQTSYFDICFEIPARQGNRKIIISIELTRGFPLEPPVLRCKNERHKYIAPQSFIINKAIHPGLVNWTSSNDLGSILNDIRLNEFRTEPPVPLAPTWDSTYNNPLALPLERISDNAILNRIIDSSNVTNSAPATPPAQSSAPRPILHNHVELTVRDFITMLSSKKEEELESIMNNLNDYVKDLDSVTQCATNRKRAQAEAMRIDTETAQMLTELGEMKEQLKERSAENELLSAKLQALQQQKQHIQSKYSKQGIAEGLLAIAHQEEDLSENLASSFSRGEINLQQDKPIDLDTFITRFLESRCLYRARLAKRAILLSHPYPSSPPNSTTFSGASGFGTNLFASPNTSSASSSTSTTVNSPFSSFRPR